MSTFESEKPIARIAYSIAQLSEVTTLSQQHLRNEIKNGRLKARHIGRRVLVLAVDAEEYLLQHEMWKPGKAR